MGEFDWKKSQKVTFTLLNIGNYPLVINDILTSCSCVKIEYSREPTKSGDNLNIVVTYKGDYPEYINKSLKIYANINDSPLELKLKGKSKDI